MALRVRCEHCEKVFEDEAGRASPRRLAEEKPFAPGEIRQVTLFCPFCEEATTVEVKASRLGNHTVNRGDP